MGIFDYENMGKGKTTCEKSKQLLQFLVSDIGEPASLTLPIPLLIAVIPKLSPITASDIKENKIYM